MRRRHLAIALRSTGLGLLLLVGHETAQAQSLREQLVGAWEIVSADQTAPDGTAHQLFGADPMGLLMLDPTGKVTQIIVCPDRPKFAANNRLKGTPEENQAAVQGTVANFGDWTVDEENSTLVILFESGMYPNQEGETSRRKASIAGDELTLLNPSTGAGMSSALVWRRVKAP
jgi:hypothetical protein